MKKLFWIFLLLPLFFVIPVTQSHASVLFSDPVSGTLGTNWNPTGWTVDNQGVYGSDGVVSPAQYFKDFGTSDQILKLDINWHDSTSRVIFGCRANSNFSNIDQYNIKSGSNIILTEGLNGNYNNLGPGGITINFSGTHHYELDCLGSTATLKQDGTTIDTETIQSTSTGIRLFIGEGSSSTDSLSNVEVCDSAGCAAPTPTPTPTPAPGTIAASPASGTVTVGTPFNVDVVASGQAFNAAQANVAVSPNLSITGLHNATSNACNLQYTQTPSVSNPSFAGAIYNSSSTNCKVYTLTLNPTSAGTGTVTFTNASMKAYVDNSEILSGVQNGSYTINAAAATPTPTPPLSGLTITSPTETYLASFTLTGTKDANTTTVFVNGSSTGVTYPTSTTWQAPVTLTLGSNNTAGSNTFAVYGADGNGNQTATTTGTVSRHSLGDINGDGVVDLTDASLFAVDWGKTSNLTYILSDMNGDGSVDLTDLSILAKLEGQ